MFKPVRNSPYKDTAGYSGAAAGTVKANSLPSPTVLLAEITPPWASTMCRAIESPRPVPGCERAASVLKKRSNI